MSPAPIDGFDATGPGDFGHLAMVLDEVVAFLNRFMAATEEQLDVVALWAAFTHAADQFGVAPYLHIKSATKRSGKSLLLDLLEQLVLRGRATANISPAAMYRMIDESHPTLLFDEIDNIFVKGKSADPSLTALTGLINAGWRKGRPAYRMGGANMRTLEEFDPFGPKALAGIGNALPDTTADRTIPIKLDRKARNVVKERYRVRIHEHQARALGERLGEAVAAVDGLSERWPDLPPVLNDRQQDIWEPLLALADAAGEEWGERARAAADALHDNSDATESLGMKLLADIKVVFTTDKVLTKHLVAMLRELDESPWSDWRGGNGLSSSQLVNMLAPFGVKSKAIRVGADRGRGFELYEFFDVFDRYLEAEEPGPGTGPGSHDGDGVDGVDIDPEPQVKPVNTRRLPSVDANVDSPEQGELAVVNGVNGDNGHQAIAGSCGSCGGRTGRAHDHGWLCSRCRLAQGVSA